MPGASLHELRIHVKINGSESVSGADGETLDLNHGDSIQRFRIDQRSDAPDFCMLEFALEGVNTSLAFLDSFKTGDEVEVLLGYETEETVFKGETVSVEMDWRVRGSSVVRVGAYDFFHRLTRGSNSKTWGDGHTQDQKIPDVAKSVVGDATPRKGGPSHGLSAKTGSSDAKVPYLSQYEINNFQFLVSNLGRQVGFVLDEDSATSQKSLSFDAPTLSGTPVVQLTRESEETASKKPTHVNVRLSTAKQVKRVEVRGWSPTEKKAVIGTAESLSANLGGDTEGPAEAGTAHYGAAGDGDTLTIVDVPVEDATSAKAIAQSVLDDLAMEFVTGQVVFEGDPTVKPGKILELFDFGRFTGKYLIDSCVHEYSTRGSTPYVCRCGVKRNDIKNPA